MIYAMSDLHGCYDKYRAMLAKINLSRNDTLYVLGDVIDRGNDGIKILLDMMNRSNIIPLLGNHELMAYSVLRRLNVEITEDNYSSQLDYNTMKMWQEWLFNGGEQTQREFSSLNYSRRKRILDYLEEFSLYEIVNVNGKTFLLVHAGLGNFSENKDINDYDINDFIWSRCDYEKVYFQDRILVTGHTPTFMIDKNYSGKIYSKNNHIAIDCGAVYGERLGCICLDTLEEFYV